MLLVLNVLTTQADSLLGMNINMIMRPSNMDSVRISRP